MIGLSRRDFLKYSLSTGLCFGSSLSLSSTKTASKAHTLLYSAAMNRRGEYVVVAVSDQGKIIFKTPLPARAHAMIMRPKQNEVIVFARRPDYFIFVLNAQTGQVIHRLKSDDNRPLCGHGVFSKTGDKLYVTANDIDHQHSVIQVLDAKNNYQKIKEFSSGGIGAHEVRLLSDGKTLVVANGGILTHPESGRAKLNLETMTPALTYLDKMQGRVIANYQLEKRYHQLSIRHLAVNQEDTVCFAMQYQGARDDQFPLVGFHQKGQTELQLSQLPSLVLSAMKNYCGSVCVDQSGHRFAISSPRGNLITTWSDQGTFINAQTLQDGCGIATSATTKAFYFSSGTGDIHHYYGKENKRLPLGQFKHYRWDNHLLSHTKT
ncbi:MAG: DUF1513 domain-containing protein [Cocleimonas sp.]|nr:DUF1513 domain-containing protein [Cocleimonas sp.]